MAQINKPSDYFNTILYTGDGAASKSLTGVGFQPDVVWIKSRSNADQHNLYDAVRGTGKFLRPNGNDVEQTGSNNLLSFDSDGFTVGTHTPINRSSGTHVAWNWKANGSTTVSNTDGDITSNVSVNSTAGFSIVSFVGNGGTNQTIGHGLSQKPDLIIAKNRDNAQNFRVWHKSYNATNDIFYLNTTNAKLSNSDAINSVQDTTFTATANSSFIGNGNNVIAYCWHEVKGYSKFGMYTGNGNADGTFVYTGFKPAFVIYKGAAGTGTTDNWEMHDSKRDTSNPMDTVLYPNTSTVESNPASTTDRLDFLSNGFKIRTGSTDYNADASEYIYMAFAEQPLVGTNNIPATAR